MVAPKTTVLYGDAWELALTLEPASVDCIVTSPPYWCLRDYGHPGQFGLEASPAEYVGKLVDLFARLRPALKDEGTVWLNLGDSYGSGGMSNPSSKSTLGGAKDRGAADYRITRGPVSGLKPKDLVGIPWRVAFALQDDGWYLRSDIIWSKPNPMPESVTDRPTKAHEYVFLLAKSERYWFDQEAVREENTYGGVRPSDGAWAQDEAGRPGPDGKQHLYGNPNGRNIRTVWTIATQPYSGFEGFSRSLADYVGADGKPYIASPDCPKHGRLASPEKWRRALSGELPVDLSLRNPDSESHRGLGHVSAMSASRGDTPNTCRRPMTDCPCPESAPERSPESSPESRTSCGLLETTSDAQTPCRSCRSEGGRSGQDDRSDSLGQPCAQTATGHSTQTRRTDLALATSQPCMPCARMSDRTDGIQAQPDYGGPDPSTPESRTGADCEPDASPSGRTTARTARIRKSACSCIPLYHVDHFAVFPQALAERCIKAGCPEGGTVLDPFAGSGTTLYVARKLGRNSVGFELNEEYRALIEDRLKQGVLC